MVTVFSLWRKWIKNVQGFDFYICFRFRLTWGKCFNHGGNLYWNITWNYARFSFFPRNLITDMIMRRVEDYTVYHRALLISRLLKVRYNWFWHSEEKIEKSTNKNKNKSNAIDSLQTLTNTLIYYIRTALSFIFGLNNFHHFFFI